MNKAKNENELFLILQKEFFHKILSGEKKEEFRSFTEFYITRLCQLDQDGEIIGVKSYDFVVFQMGYSKNAPKIKVEFKGVHVETEEENAEFLTSENCIFCISLGEVVEKINI